VPRLLVGYGSTQQPPYRKLGWADPIATESQQELEFEITVAERRVSIRDRKILLQSVCD